MIDRHLLLLLVAAESRWQNIEQGTPTSSVGVDGRFVSVRESRASESWADHVIVAGPIEISVGPASPVQAPPSNDWRNPIGGPRLGPAPSSPTPRNRSVVSRPPAGLQDHRSSNVHHFGTGTWQKNTAMDPVFATNPTPLVATDGTD